MVDLEHELTEKWVRARDHSRLIVGFQKGVAKSRGQEFRCKLVGPVYGRGRHQKLCDTIG